MFRQKTALFVLIIGLFLVGTMVSAANIKARSPEQLYKEMMLQLDELEQRMPRAQTDLFKLRADVKTLYSYLSARETDPVDENGKLLVPDLDAAGDFYADCANSRNDGLKEELYRKINNHVSVGYQSAQDIVFTDIDNHDGYVECVYTGRKLKTNCEPSATNMNIEHTWPQSQGATGIAKCDLHHLFPSDSKANGIRGNNPFGNVSHPTWEQGGSKTDKHVFEVRPEQRGDTARGKFYFSVRYRMPIPPQEEKVLRQWHKEDPVTDAERKRNDRIENYQHNRNPFVDRPDFVDMINDF